MKISDQLALSKNLQPVARNQDRTEGFAGRFKEVLKEVNRDQIESDQAASQVMEEKLGVHEGMLRLQEADLSFRLFLQVRSKVLDAYREIMRLQF